MGAPSLWSQVPSQEREKLRRYVFERDGYRCQVRGPSCNGRAEELDHIVPCADDPSRIRDPNNMRSACRHCNGGRRSNRTAAPSRAW